MGVLLYNSKFNIVSNNKIKNNTYGLWLTNSHNNTITKNIFDGRNSSYIGIRLGSDGTYDAFHNIVEYNIIKNYKTAIQINSPKNKIMYNDFYSNEVYIENDYIFIPIPVKTNKGLIFYFYAIYLIIAYGPELSKCKIRNNYWNESRILPKFFHKFETGGYYYIIVDALYVSWDPRPARQPNCDFE